MSHGSSCWRPITSDSAGRFAWDVTAALASTPHRSALFANSFRSIPTAQPHETRPWQRSTIGFLRRGGIPSTPSALTRLNEMAGGNLRPIPVDAALLEAAEPKARAQFFQRWKQELRG